MTVLRLSVLEPIPLALGDDEVFQRRVIVFLHPAKVPEGFLSLAFLQRTQSDAAVVVGELIFPGDGLQLSFVDLTAQIVDDRERPGHLVASGVGVVQEFLGLVDSTCVAAAKWPRIAASIENSPRHSSVRRIA